MMRFEDANRAMHAAGVGVSTAERLALWLLMHNDEVGLSELARGATVSRAAMTAMADRMSAAGFIKRVVHPTDRRTTMVSLRAPARRRLEKMMEDAE